jgi:alpha-tubulin suppressor-like RCC1 family protein
MRGCVVGVLSCVLVTVVLSACGGDHVAPPVDAGADARIDAGTDAGADAGTDAAADAGTFDVAELSAGSGHTCARSSSGAVACWGGRIAIGDGTGTRRLTPTAALDLTDALEIAGGGGHTCARKRSGAVVCWGYNGTSQLGDGSTTTRLTPTPVSGLTDAVEVSAGGSHTCTHHASGAVNCWGGNNYGQKGDGSFSFIAYDAGEVSSLADAVEISGGDEHTCARRSSGRVACWGRNPEGELGDGNLSHGYPRCGELTVSGDCSPTPTEVTGLTDAVEISAGYWHTCARRSSGAVVCWGQNTYGQLGDGGLSHVMCPANGSPTDCSPTPVAVSGVVDAVEISAGGDHTCARRATGGVVCWGMNAHGQLGDGTTTDRLTPTPVLDLTDAVEITTGGQHTCARRATGAVVCWGWNREGQLGDGTTTDRLTPTPVVGL